IAILGPQKSHLVARKEPAAERRRYNAPMRSLLLPLLILAAGLAVGQNVLPAKRLTTPPTIDGAVDDTGEWADAPGFEGLHDEEDGSRAPEQGRFWLAYDDTYIYFAARLLDSQPQRIAAEEYRTNTTLGGDDSVSLHLDVGGSGTDFSVFTINSRGATSISLAGGRAFKREWSGEFLARGRRTAEGWEAEARIPWRILPLPAAGPRDLRFNVSRYWARGIRSFTHVFTGQGRREHTPRWIGVHVPAQTRESSLKLLPYVYGGFERGGHEIANAGLDLKTSLTEGIELVGSINPDFRNIESQILGLEFSRFERLADEARPFFLEGAEYLNSALFASQRIRTFDAGINLYGKLGGSTTFAALNATDFGRENAFAATATHTLPRNQTLRAAVTSLRRPGLENDAYLLAYFNQMGPFSLFLRNMSSRDSGLGTGDNALANLSFSQKGINVNASYQVVDANFRPRLGFFPESNYRSASMEAVYFRNFKGGYWNDAGGGFFLNESDRINGEFYRRGHGAFFFTTNRYGLAMSLNYSREKFLDSRDHFYSAFFGYPRGARYYGLNVGGTWGHVAGSPYRSISIGGRKRLFGRLYLNLNHQIVDHFSHREQTIAGVGYDLDADHALNCRAVRTGDDVNTYLSFRKAGNRGAEYFLIVGDPNAQRFRGSVILKALVPFELK
ncbi:MAG TPA: DUF5916 domain-containing protein, partial [Fimbriimonadaceae bacterium]|nr:DUF5916 domain-containing protein [Fimbriimonadaceae bacterium]